MDNKLSGRIGHSYRPLRRGQRVQVGIAGPDILYDRGVATAKTSGAAAHLAGGHSPVGLRRDARVMKFVSAQAGPSGPASTGAAHRTQSAHNQSAAAAEADDQRAAQWRAAQGRGDVAETETGSATGSQRRRAASKTAPRRRQRVVPAGISIAAGADSSNSSQWSVIRSASIPTSNSWSLLRVSSVAMLEFFA